VPRRSTNGSHYISDRAVRRRLLPDEAKEPPNGRDGRAAAKPVHVDSGRKETAAPQRPARGDEGQADPPLDHDASGEIERRLQNRLLGDAFRKGLVPVEVAHIEVLESFGVQRHPLLLERDPVADRLNSSGAEVELRVADRYP